MNRHSYASGLSVEKPAVDQNTPLRQAVMEAVGKAASLHWPESKEAFKSSEVIKISEELIKYIEEYR